MAENVEENRGRRGLWVAIVAVLAIVMWVVRSRRATAAAADIGSGWPPPRQPGARVEQQRSVPESAPGAPAPVPAPAARSAGPAPSGPPPAAATPAPRPAPPVGPAATSAPAAPGAGTAARRPSPRPRTQAPPAPAPSRDGLPQGAAVPLPDGSAPGPEYTIKGNAGSMIFHPPTSPYFARTKAGYWFRTAEDAQAAGFTEWTPKKR